MCQSFTCPFVLTPQTNDLQVLKRYTSDLWNLLNGPYHAKRLPKLWIWRACMLCYIYFDSKLMHLDIIYINLTQKILMKKLQCLNSYFFSSQFEQKKRTEVGKWYTCSLYIFWQHIPSFPPPNVSWLYWIINSLRLFPNACHT